MTAAVLPTSPAQRSRVLATGLWVFIGVVCALFGLFLTAYVMRMGLSPGDWTPIALPWQLWLSTGVLAAASFTLHRAAVASRRPHAPRVPTLLAAAGACTAAFVLSQWWAWQALQEARVTLTGNPAASFFYLLTALHVLHLLGGLVAWTVALPTPEAWRIALLARYWHFLLALWAVLFATFGLLTPEAAAFLCGRGGGT